MHGPESLGAHIRQERVGKLSLQDSLLVALLVAVTNFIWNPMRASPSLTESAASPVLLAIAGLALVTAYPA